jgi:hypothetical protein
MIIINHFLKIQESTNMIDGSLIYDKEKYLQLHLNYDIHGIKLKIKMTKILPERTVIQKKDN